MIAAVVFDVDDLRHHDRIERRLALPARLACRQIGSAGHQTCERVRSRAASTTGERTVAA